MKLSQTLKNRYFAMRHGESEANRAGKIVSDPAVGTQGFGLSPLGRSQAAASARALSGRLPTVVVSSDFLRARETAEIAARVFGVDEPSLCRELRERYFGAWDGQSSDHYERVWKLDAMDADQTEDGVESVNAVRERLAALVSRLETAHVDQSILLVAHGDPLQIMQTLFENVPGTAHRRIPHLHVADIRPLLQRAGEQDRAAP